jgi:hypothetical protein
VRPDKFRVQCQKCILPLAQCQSTSLPVYKLQCLSSESWKLPSPSFPHIHYFLPMDPPSQAVAGVEEKGDSKLAQNTASGSCTDENMEKAAPTSPVEPLPPPELPEGGFWAWATVAGA